MSSSGADKLQSVGNILMNIGVAVLIYAIVCVVVTLYIRFAADRSNSSSMWYNFPKWIQPANQWKKLAGISIGTYSYIPSSSAVQIVAASGTSLMTNVASVNDCMLACEGAADADAGCVGFLFDTVANTCSLASTLDTVIPSGASNVLYFSDSSPPMKQYFVTTGKIPAVPTAISISSVSIPTATNVATVTTTTAHEFTSGNYITITGYGSNAVTVTDSTKFTFPFRTPVDISSASGTATLVLSRIAPDATLSYFDCAKACTSNTTCSGFTFDTASGCIQYTVTPFKKEMLTQVRSTSNTYINGTPVMTPYTSSYF